MSKCIVTAFALSAVLGVGVAYSVGMGAGPGPLQGWQLWISGCVSGVIAFVSLLVACRRSELSPGDLQRMFRNFRDQIGP